MKIKVEVDLSEMYTDGDHEENCTFTEEIQYKIIQEIAKLHMAQYKSQMIEAFSVVVKKALIKHEEKFITDIFAKVIEEKRVSSKYSKSTMMSIEDYIIEQLQNSVLAQSNLSSIIEKHVTAKANEVGNELKKRYDMGFAMQIVHKLSEQKMLKDGVLGMLTKEEGSNA